MIAVDGKMALAAAPSQPKRNQPNERIKIMFYTVGSIG
jgi:hypothetical protein